MTAVVATPRQWRVALLALLLALLVFVVMAVLDARLRSDEFNLEGIPSEEITGADVTIDRLWWLEADVPVERDDAVRQALRNYPGGVPRQVALVRINSTNPPMTSDAWAVNFDPATVSAIHPSGLDAPPGPYETVYAYVFIDARTGDLVFAGDMGRPARTPPSGP